MLATLVDRGSAAAIAEPSPESRYPGEVRNEKAHIDHAIEKE
jgi:hypothetical protein